MSDIFQRQAQFYQRQLSNNKYCSFCGKPILLCMTDENGKANEMYQWEWQNKAHYNCVQNFYSEKMREQANETRTD